MKTWQTVRILVAGTMLVSASCHHKSRDIDRQAILDVRASARITWPKETRFTSASDNWIDGLLSADFIVPPDDVEKIVQQGDFVAVPAEERERLLKAQPGLAPVDTTLEWVRSETNNCLSVIYLNTKTGVGHFLRMYQDASGD